MERRTAFTLLVNFALAGCASPEFKPLVFAQDVALQDPLPGMAIVYLLRAPHDRASVPVYFNARKMALLPPASYTAVSIQPGTYSVASAAPGTNAESPASILTVRAGERRFLYTSVPTRSSVSLSFIPGGPVGAIPLFLPTTVPAGARTWNECRELDAQGLMSTSKPVMPEPGAA